MPLNYFSPFWVVLKLTVTWTLVNLWLHFTMNLYKDQSIFENKSLQLSMWSMKYVNLLFAPFLWPEKNCIYLMLQFINWLLFICNSLLNFVGDCALSCFSYGEQYNDTWSEKVTDNNKRTAFLGTSVSKGMWEHGRSNIHLCRQLSLPFSHKNLLKKNERFMTLL